MLVPLVDGCFGGADGFCHREFRVGSSGRYDGEPSTQRSVVEPCVENGGSHPLGGDAVAVSFRDALDEAVQSQAAQVVGDPSRGQLARF